MIVLTPEETCFRDRVRMRDCAKCHGATIPPLGELEYSLFDAMKDTARVQTLTWLAYYGSLDELRHLVGSSSPFQMSEILNKASTEFGGRPSPIVAASVFPHIDCLRLLISAGVNYCIEDDGGNDAVFHLVRGWATSCMFTNPANNREGVYEQALSLMFGLPLRDILLNAVRRSGWTPLMQAVSFPTTERLVRYLLRAGADANNRSRSGITPLMLAACTGDIDVIAALLTFGADPLLRDDANRTALSYAQSHFRQEVAIILDSAMHASGRIS